MGRRFAGFRVKQTYFRAFLTEPGVDGASRFFFCTDRPLAFAFAFAFPFGEALGFRLGFPLGLAESLVSDGAWHLDPRNRPKKQNIVYFGVKCLRLSLHPIVQKQSINHPQHKKFQHKHHPTSSRNRTRVKDICRFSSSITLICLFILSCRLHQVKPDK